MGYSTASLSEAIAGLCLENAFGDTDDVTGDLVDARATLREYIRALRTRVLRINT